MDVWIVVTCTFGSHNFILSPRCEFVAWVQLPQAHLLQFEDEVICPTQIGNVVFSLRFLFDVQSYRPFFFIALNANTLKLWCCLVYLTAKIEALYYKPSPLFSALCHAHHIPIKVSHFSAWQCYETSTSAPVSITSLTPSPSLIHVLNLIAPYCSFTCDCTCNCNYIAYTLHPVICSTWPCPYGHMLTPTLNPPLFLFRPLRFPQPLLILPFSTPAPSFDLAPAPAPSAPFVPYPASSPQLLLPLKQQPTLRLLYWPLPSLPFYPYCSPYLHCCSYVLTCSSSDFL
jgi:hypothetical protein